MLIAFASSNGESIDSHFASAPVFEVYEFGGKKQGFVHSAQVRAESFAGEKDSEDKVDARIKHLKECAIVYCTQIGGPAAARLVQCGIHPLKVPEGTRIYDELGKLVQLFNSGKTPPWLKKKMAN
ncbi:dinitrogenase iron-molybdenum cofactor biosynthesis protein [Desulfosporosinus acidiphilus SJ4]|uniref:Dinitrogenase iron-molybdenum cofactor biosynthesis protein n=1 Tax=Desulfosporosinus acidiphilus (strain DSM 22704 / JCM 16185 / SJ4) TaxID=646529 RepID=I4DAS2_DESAJ|nr:NifB/NifX family molybdenum-iron cluster-binding protein [Desulfosporosinus acidiphilus]AFM42896.1 dinitrogenase iron-molybdenum cofactor biosynthesis protein [Desulfosporosinus acidiphilus SJ4]